MSAFNGFGPALRFLGELMSNNDREWFDENKARYESEVREPARAFVRAMAPKLSKISKAFVADDRKVGGSIKRIYKDVRFAKDKTPYKTNLGIQFRHQAGMDVHAPGFYVHVQPANMFLGAGMWRPEPEPLLSLRKFIAAEPARWRSAVERTTTGTHWQQRGESLKRAPKGFSPDHADIEDIKRTDFILDTSLSLADVTSPRLVDVVAAEFAQSVPYMKFLCGALKLPC